MECNVTELETSIHYVKPPQYNITTTVVAVARAQIRVQTIVQSKVKVLVTKGIGSMVPSAWVAIKYKKLQSK